jgi:hypothetical protein
MLKYCRWMPISALVLLSGSHLASQDFASAATQFAAKISEHSTSTPVSLNVKNLSSLPNSAVSSIGIELMRQLQARGWKVNPNSGEILAITLSENLNNYVWSAQLQLPRPQGAEVVLFEFAKARNNAARTTSGDRITLARALLVSSDAPLLDAALMEGTVSEGSHLLALTPSAVQLFQWQSLQWRLVQIQPLSREPLSTRDVRGRIVPDQGNSFDAFLPAIHCNGVVASTLSLTCRQSDDPWPLADDRRVLAFYAPNRNYFNGVISGANAHSENLEPFYSAALLSDRIVYSDLSGRPRMTATGRPPSLVSAKWGSNLAGMQSGCRSDLLLASGTGDFTLGDFVTAFRPLDSDFASTSDPLVFDGPVVSLKTSSDHRQVIAIILSSGRYEAYLLTASCG